MIANLDKLANEFITEFNAIHRAGFGLNDTVGNRDFSVVQQPVILK